MILTMLLAFPLLKVIVRTSPSAKPDTAPVTVKPLDIEMPLPQELHPDEATTKLAEKRKRVMKKMNLMINSGKSFINNPPTLKEPSKNWLVIIQLDESFLGSPI